MHKGAIRKTLAALALLALSALGTRASEPLAVPVLVLEPGMHTSAILGIATDREGRLAASAAIDGTVRLWDAADGTLLQTLRLPRGVGHVGKAFAVAMSPDGAVVAVGGWTRWNANDPQEQIYLYATDDGRLVQRLEGLPNVTLALAFSPDGRRLAAGLGGQDGVRIWQQTDAGWQALGGSGAGARSSALAFAPDGRLAAASHDGHVRLFDGEGVPAQDRNFGDLKPVGLAFSPDGAALAVSFAGQGHVTLLDATTLADRGGRHDEAQARGDLEVLAWSAEGLYAAGSRRLAEDTADVLLWSGAGMPRRTAVANNTVTGLVPLGNGDLLVSAADPMLARLSPTGETLWERTAQKIDFREQNDILSVSEDGLIVDFSPGAGADPLRFDVGRLALGPVEDAGLTVAALRPGDRIADWKDSQNPLLDGRPLALDPAETARAAASDMGRGQIYLGTDWNLRAYDGEGKALWSRAVPSAAWAVNATANGRLVVAGYGDGTIRWHRAGDGTEILALFVKPGGEDWVVWTPEGLYAATPGARSVLRWQVNRGWDAPAEAIPVHMVPNTLRPGVIPHVLPQQGTAGALAVAELSEIRNSVRAATGAVAAPGAVLHVLAIGVGDYNDDHANHLDLAYAARDADDFARALVSSQLGLYSRVNVQRVLDGQATHEGILRSLASLRDLMSRGDGSDLAVVYFSGHGAIVNDDFYLLPHDVDTRDPVKIAATALNAVQVQREIAQMSRFGRVLVLLDACRSGASTASGQQLAVDGDRLRSLMQGPNISVLNSSTADEDSLESSEWQNGAFTEVILEAIRGHAADKNANGILTMTEMTGYLSERVPQITGGRQNPSVEVRFESAVFATGS